ncbi:MAG: hypothetical protein ACOVNL_09165 [Prochlorococcaceae cyanobacterium]
MSPASRSPSAAEAAGPGVWLPLGKLRSLPLSAEVLVALLEELRSTSWPEPMSLASPARLAAEAANLLSEQLREALEHHPPAECLARLERLERQVNTLVALQPAQAATLWERFGALQAQVIARTHGAVFCAEEDLRPRAEERAALCWQALQRLQGAYDRPWLPPEWLPVLEQQLVQEGALLWETQPGDEAPERCLDLYLRLAELLDPVPEWVLGECRRRMESGLNAVLEGDDIDARQLVPWLARLQRIPVAEERSASFEAAILRARLSLELLQIGPRPRMGPPLELVEAEWLGEAPLQLVVANSETPAEGCFNLAPFLDGDLEGAQAALEAFLAEEAQPEREALEPITSLLEGLAQEPRALPASAAAVLASIAGQWQRNLQQALPPPEEVNWLEGAVVELEATELQLLQLLVEQRQGVEEALLELRRRHHDTAFWDVEERPEPGVPATPLEVLREFHRRGGFYPSSHAPMESLLRWAQPALAALGSSTGWSEDAEVAALWLPLKCGNGPLAGMPGTAKVARAALAELLEGLAGQEVVFVGHAGEAWRQAHRQGELFSGEAFGLRCLEGPASRHPKRPAAGFEDSLAECLEAVEALQRERPFGVLLADCGAYRLPLAVAMRQRFGIRTVCGAGCLTGAVPVSPAEA